jgi:hypothetical protein
VLGEALALARKDDASAAQVARLAATLAPLYGLSIVSAAQASSAVNAAASASTSAASAGAGAAASASVGASAGTVASVKVIAAVLAVGALGTAGLLSMRAPSAAPTPAPPHSASAEVAPSAPPAPVQAVPLPSAESLHAPQASRPASEVVAPEPARVARAANIAPTGSKRRSHENAPVEAQLLTEAHGALASDASRALRLADEHRARFPRGALAAERELLAVRALERLDQNEQARKRIARARRELPSSAPVQRAAERLGAAK